MPSPFQQSILSAAADEAQRQNEADRRERTLPQRSWLESAGTPAFVAGAGADWLSTALALHENPRLQEANPMINWVPTTAGKIGMGVAQDIAGYLLAKKILKNHPTLLNAGLLAAGIGRGALAARNLQVLTASQSDR